MLLRVSDPVLQPAQLLRCPLSALRLSGDLGEETL
jgi:hypothetical protein